ncbi:MAG TPA: VOC family protein [Jatrophihabitans sp.]|nr:VOC family protein [Jatrophihabitans sp.]
MTAGGRHGLRVQISIDCADPSAMAAFWNTALGYVGQPPPEGFASWADFADSVGMPAERHGDIDSSVDPAGVGPRLLFNRVPEGKVAKNRWHLDVNVGAGLRGGERQAVVREHAARLVAAGGTLVGERQDEFSWWIVLTDIEGNEFCLQ